MILQLTDLPSDLTTLFNHPDYLLSRIPLADPPLLASDQLAQLKVLLDDLYMHQETKMPGIRSLY